MVSIPGLGGPDDLPAGLAPASGPRAPRRRIGGGPSAPVKIASGCDRRCAFCAIPMFRGSYLSRPVAEVVAEAQWLVENGVREAVLVSENSSAYGKDLAGNLETLLEAPSIAAGLNESNESWRRVVAKATEAGVPIPGFSSALSYFDLVRAERTNAALTQGLRDFFGSHTYRRIDKEGTFHTNWSGDRTESEAVDTH